jgi:hypothetical protein
MSGPQKKSSQKRKVGRPSLGATETLKIKLPGALLSQIDALVEPGGRSALIREAIEREIARRARGQG